MLVEKNAIVPVLRMNNRRVNQEFMESTLGLKTVLEESAYVELTGHTGQKDAQLVLMESPSMRVRAVKGKKKVEKISLKVANATEIESLLAKGIDVDFLYKGEKGYAFEATSPEGYTFLVHAEESPASLAEVTEKTNFVGRPDFKGLTEFVVDAIVINTPNPAASQDFYGKVLPEQTLISFTEAEGEDLLAASDETWDIESLRIAVAEDFDFSTLEAQLDVDYFKDKKERFLQTLDPSHIEMWFEK